MNDNYNIVLIMADQLTPFMMGAYGNTQVITPNLDRLAGEGVLFEAAYSPCPLCTPARAAMMTGKYVGRLNCFDNVSAFPSEEPTFAHYLTNAGYETVLCGKMHFVGADQLHGFTTRLTTDIYPSDYSWLPQFIDKEKHIMQPDSWGNAIHYNRQSAKPKEWNDGLQYDEEVQVKAREYLYKKGMEEEKTPFCLCVSYHHPHDPFQPPEKYWNMYEGKDIAIPDLSHAKPKGDTLLDCWLNTGFHRTDVFDVTKAEDLYAVRRAYSGLVTYIDDKVGQLLDDLEQCGLRENTVVIFTSDHGDMLGERGMVQKRCFYEWSSRIPLIISAPGGKLKGKKVAAPVSLVDIAPTVMSLAGCEDTLREMDGVSLFTVMEQGREPVFSESHGEGILWPCYMVRENHWKYTFIYGREAQLFLMDTDPDEKNNVSGQEEYEEVESHLKNLILKRFEPEAVISYMESVIPKKKVVREAMKRTGASWDFIPFVDESKRYSRK